MGEHFLDKSHFVVFDCFDGTLLEYFKNETAITAEPPQREPCAIVEIIEDIWSNGIGTTTSADWSSAYNASRRRCRARRGACLPLIFRVAMLGNTPAIYYKKRKMRHRALRTAEVVSSVGLFQRLQLVPHSERRGFPRLALQMKIFPPYRKRRDGCMIASALEVKKEIPV
jgi:hypothetical protein